MSNEVAAPVGGDTMLYCNHTAFPPSYPVNWTRGHLDTPITQQDTHYSFNGSYLIIHEVTVEHDDITVYRCTVTNPCDYSVSDYIIIHVILLPPSITQLAINDGPTIDSITLTWSEDTEVLLASNDIDGYTVRVMKGSHDYYEDYQYIPFHSDAETRLTGLKPGTNYSVMVLTYNIAGESESNVITFMTNVSGK